LHHSSRDTRLFRRTIPSPCSNTNAPYRAPPYLDLSRDLRKTLPRAEITARRGNFTPPLGPEPLSDPIHVELSLHRLLLGEVPDGEVLVADHQADLALASVATHPPAKVSELGKIPGVFDVGRCRIAMHNDRLILHQCTTSFVVAPDALCFRVGRCAPEDTAEHLQGCVDPARLVNGCHPIAFNTRDKQD